MNIELPVSGMTCGHCKAAVETALKSVGGVSDAQVNLGEGKATVHGDGLDTEALIAAIVEEGYGARVAGT